MGSSPLHASTVGLIRSLRTNHISPQFHVVYDDLFETVHASAEEAPASWPDLFTFNRFKSDYDDEDFVPALPDEWLTPVELSQRQRQEQVQRSQDGSNPVDDPYIPAPDDDEMPFQRAPPEQPDASQRAQPLRGRHPSWPLTPAVLRGRPNCQRLPSSTHCRLSRFLNCRHQYAETPIAIVEHPSGIASMDSTL
jgi:hypothetical protein